MICGVSWTSWPGRRALNRKANDKIYELNQQASKYVETFALLYTNFERICAEKEVEEQFDCYFDESLKMLSESRSRCIGVAEIYARIEDDVNEGLRVIRNHFQETATATLALTCGKNDRGSQRGPSTCRKPWPWWTLCWPGIRTTTASRWS